MAWWWPVLDWNFERTLFQTMLKYNNMNVNHLLMENVKVLTITQCNELHELSRNKEAGGRLGTTQKCTFLLHSLFYSHTNARMHTGRYTRLHAGCSLDGCALSCLLAFSLSLPLSLVGHVALPFLSSHCNTQHSLIEFPPGMHSSPLTFSSSALQSQTSTWAHPCSPHIFFYWSRMYNVQWWVH